ncbi:uncharacterized protein LY89DRAFT_740815 [Mollisia scopiformis]|uniref:Uncharacterized protein n=1 Tax=Mollisia scopiformis TaxID=149040 RepID=A0A132BBV0_MOLSC|nr:uncharacterized protein LY89DRAFT_740815 [Mollisia scopiformis]KUJ09743.1 hypothetical protein LY89DRAFT_740815 [Mollisia scopiformis]
MPPTEFPIEFNYKKPAVLPGKGIVVRPNYPTETGPINKALAIARNSEVPNLLLQAGELTSEEEKRIWYHRLISKEAIYVGEEGSETWNGTFLDEKAVFELPTAGQNMVDLRKKILKRGVGKFKNHSAFEGILAGRDFTKDKHKVRRSYVLGHTVHPDATSCGPAECNADRLKHQEEIAEVSNLISRIAPKDLLKMVTDRAATDVPMTIGSEDNPYFTTAQLNFSDGDEISLELTLGEAGALHVDSKDDATRWTVLISLSHNPEGYWPGRTMITAHRAYAVMAPFTILIFNAVNPHISLGPIKMANSTRAPYVPSIPEIPYLDPTVYIYARLMIVNYPKKSIMDDSPILARNSTPMLLRGPDNLNDSHPQALPSALMAFGTLRNQHEWMAMSDAFCKARTRSFVDEENGKGNQKSGKITWTDDLGSTFKHMNLKLRDDNMGKKGKKMSLQAEYGPKPFACFQCASTTRYRAASVATLKAHFKTKHEAFVRKDVEPSMDPAYKKPLVEDVLGEGDEDAILEEEAVLNEGEDIVPEAFEEENEKAEESAEEIKEDKKRDKEKLVEVPRTKKRKITDFFGAPNS